MFNRKVVVVDEEPTARTVIAFMLEKDGFEPVTFSSSGAARASLLSTKEMPCLLVVDLGPNGTRGIDFAQWLLDASPQTGVIFTTTGCVPDVASHGLPASRVQVLQKPFHAEQFRGGVDALLMRVPERAQAQASGTTRDDIGS